MPRIAFSRIVLAGALGFALPPTRRLQAANMKVAIRNRLKRCEPLTTATRTNMISA